MALKALCLAAALLLPFPAAAQDDGDEPVLVEALVVNARTPGPAWWSVSKGETKVWVLGLSGRVPPTSQWEAATYERRLKASGRVIYAVSSARMRVSKAGLKADRPWADELTQEERERFAEVAALTRKPVKFYTKFRPNFAALLINGQLNAQSGGATGDPLMARAKALKVQGVPVQARLREGLRGSFAPGGRDDLTCFRWALSRRDSTGRARAQARSEAWMRGDVESLVSRAMSYDPCIRAMKALNTLVEDQETALADEIARTLDQGQGAVALVGLVPLLRQQGVLDQLRARGYRVTTPGD